MDNRRNASRRSRAGKWIVVILGAFVVVAGGAMAGIDNSTTSSDAGAAIQADGADAPVVTAAPSTSADVQVARPADSPDAQGASEAEVVGVYVSKLDLVGTVGLGGGGGGAGGAAGGGGGGAAGGGGANVRVAQY